MNAINRLLNLKVAHLTLAVATALGCVSPAFAGESHEHPPGVPLNPAVVFTAPESIFPPEIEALRREIDTEQHRLRREYRLLVALAVEEKAEDSPELHSAKWTELRNGWSRLRERRAILDKMLEEHRERIAKDRTDTPFDPVVAEEPITPGG